MARLGLSIWNDSNDTLIPASSTIKGFEDVSISNPDCPLVFDELQQLKKTRGDAVVENLWMFAANGRRRILANKTGIGWRGGEYRYGVSFFLAEDPIMETLQKGAQYRVIELHGPPLPMDDSALADKIGRVSADNYGLVGVALANLINEGYEVPLGEIKMFASDLYTRYRGIIKGDDPYAIALVRQGLKLLGEVTGRSIPYDGIIAWLIEQVGGQRSATVEQDHDIMINLLETLVNANWREAGNDTLHDGDGFLAWRRTSVIGNHLTHPMEIVPTHRIVVELLKRWGVNEKIFGKWVKRGWLVPQNTNCKWPRRWSGQVAKVIRVSPAGLALVGLDPDFKELV